MPDKVSDASLNYRNRVPEARDWDFVKLIKEADGLKFGHGTPNGPLPVDKKYKDCQVAIIGAGAAGLSAGYEFMKLGFQPVFHEMQLEDNKTHVRPGGRAFTWDFNAADSHKSQPGAFTSRYPDKVTGPGPLGDSNAVATGAGRMFADFGAMRYPSSHLALRTYVDDIFGKDYYFGAGADVRDKWRPFPNPALFKGASGEPVDADKLSFPTAFFKTCIDKDPRTPTTARELYRIEQGETVGTVNADIRTLSKKYWDLAARTQMLATAPCAVDV